MAPQWLTALWNRGSTDRRQRRRITQYFDCTWLSAWGEERCRISSLSPTGCYIDSRFTVPAEGTQVQDINVTLPTGQITLQGTVVYAMPGVGFAVRFTQVDADARARLNALIQS
jgi:PilZ domain